MVNRGANHPKGSIHTPGCLNRLVQPSLYDDNTLLAGQDQIGSSLLMHLAVILAG